MLKFGTSGLRGLVEEMTDRECFLFSTAFIRHAGSRFSFRKVSVAGDLRSSTPRILRAVHAAILTEGLEVDYCGFLGTPALTLQGMRHANPSIMVTGSHIPDDRNGLKFSFPTGEILKADEIGILQKYQEARNGPDLDQFFDPVGCLREAHELGAANPSAESAYARRYSDSFPVNALKGMRVVVYEHSSVARDLLCDLLAVMGADVFPVGRSEQFVAVDTEAVENIETLAGWVREYAADALVSTDGDGDRPLLVDDRGRLVRGDVLGLLVARFLAAAAVVLPINSSTLVEKSGSFRQIRRVRIGSPFVVAALSDLIEQGFDPAVGYEANGGFLLGTEVRLSPDREPLASLPTRDAVLPLLAALRLSVVSEKPLSALVSDLPPVYACSGILRRFPTDIGCAVVEFFHRNGLSGADQVFGTAFGKAVALDLTDGARITFANGEILHLRPSGNAPEFRCYTEAATDEKAVENNQRALAIVRDQTSKFLGGAPKVGS